MLHQLNEATRLEAIAEGRYGGATHPAYANIVGPFGGATAATLINAVMLDQRRLGDPIALTVNFCGPYCRRPLRGRGKTATRRQDDAALVDGAHARAAR